MSTIYGYARVSTQHQDISRQISNIMEAYPTVKKIYQEAYTGTKMEGRDELDKLLSRVSAGDSIVFDAVDRMSRNADEGVQLYMELFDKGVNLVFLKNRNINTEVYRNAQREDVVPMTGTTVDVILTAINEYLKRLAVEQVRIAFEQAQAEVEHLHQRVREGIRERKNRGESVGQIPGAKLTVKKAAPAKRKIMETSRDFNGSLSDEDCIKVCGISRPTFYKYKKELRAELAQAGD